MMKKVISFALILTLLLSACGSTPANTQENNTSSTVQEAVGTEEKDDSLDNKTTEKVEETVELYIPCFFDFILPFIPDNVLKPLEEYGATNFKKNADASQTCTISKSGITKYIEDSVSNYNKWIQSQENYPVKELIFEGDYKEAKFQGDPSNNDLFQYALEDALIPHLLSTLLYGPDTLIDVSAPNAEDPSKLNTISYPPKELDFNSMFVGVNLDDIDVLIMYGSVETNYANEPCFSVNYIFTNNSTEKL